jgi:hypothetical protein
VRSGLDAGRVRATWTADLKASADEPWPRSDVGVSGTQGDGDPHELLVTADVEKLLVGR